MNSKQYSIFEEDLKIKNALVETGILKNNRIAMCGKWFKRKIINNSNAKKKQTRYFCLKWGCRMCRRKLIDNIISKHTSNNNSFVNSGGKILVINLKVPNFTYSIDNDIYAKFKNALTILKESRGWEKIKYLTKGQFHYDNIELTYSANEFQLINNIIYGVTYKNIDLNKINNILYDYWSHSLKRIGINYLSVKSAYAQYIEKISIDYTDRYNKKSTNYSDTSFELRNEIEGTLENLEFNYMKILTQPTTSLKAVEYTKQRKLKEIGVVITNINSMLRKSRHGRIWFYSK